MSPRFSVLALHFQNAVVHPDGVVARRGNAEQVAKRNVLANFAGRAWSALMALAFLPLYIRFLGIESYGLVGIFGLRDTPSAVRERIAADVIAVLKDPEITQKLTATGQVVNPGTPAEFSAAIDKQKAQAAEAGKILGIKPAS